VRGLAVLMPCLVTLAVLFTMSHPFAVAAGVGDQVELQVRNRAGVPLHAEPRGTHDFQRIPDGTKATVMELAQDGRWLKLTLPDGRTGWVTSRYVIGPTPHAPSTGTASATMTPQRVEEGLVQRVADGDTITVITPNQTKLRIRMLGIDAPETPKGTKFPGQPYGTDAATYLTQMVAGKKVRVEIYGVTDTSGC
jgi:nuclease-like protein